MRTQLAEVYVPGGEREQALALFQKTLGPAAAWNNLGYILMTQGKKEQAEKAFRQALDLNPRFYANAKENLEKLQRREETTVE
jgi:Tfp pilus assembly protein PilF